MTISADRPLNLDLVGEIFTVITTERYPLTEERFAANYPDENVAAYLAAFLDPELFTFLEDDTPKPPLRPVKREVEQLANKIRNSGGWNFVINKLETHKVLYSIGVGMALDNFDEITAAVEKVIQFLMAAL